MQPDPVLILRYRAASFADALGYSSVTKPTPG